MAVNVEPGEVWRQVLVFENATDQQASTSDSLRERLMPYAPKLVTDQGNDEKGRKTFSVIVGDTWADQITEPNSLGPGYHCELTTLEDFTDLFAEAAAQQEEASPNLPGGTGLSAKQLQHAMHRGQQGGGRGKGGALLKKDPFRIVVNLDVLLPILLAWYIVMFVVSLAD
eukprot:Selendium_serpulae@DN10934_c0_g1_i1.p1